MYFKIEGQNTNSGWGAVSSFRGVVTIMSRHFDLGSEVKEVKSAFYLTPAEARIFASSIIECATQAEGYKNGD
mgnify:CR=1 FL=1